MAHIMNHSNMFVTQGGSGRYTRMYPYLILFVPEIILLQLQAIAFAGVIKLIETFRDVMKELVSTSTT